MSEQAEQPGDYPPPFQPTKMDAAKAMTDLHHLVEAVADGLVYADYDACAEMLGKAQAALVTASAYMLEGAPDV